MTYSAHTITPASLQVDTLLDEVAKLEQSVEKINKLEAENGATPTLNALIHEALQRSSQLEKIQEEAKKMLTDQGVAFEKIQTIEEELLEVIGSLPEAIEVPTVRSSSKHTHNKIHI